MKVVHVTFYYPEGLNDEKEFLKQYYTITGWAEALGRRGAEVIVMNRFSKESFLEKNNVQYYFIQDRLKSKFRGWHLPLKFLRKISRLDADVIHLHHLSLSIQTFVLRLLLKKKTAIIIQHHGGPYPKGLKKSVHDKLNSIADGFFFTTVEQGKQWFKSKMLQLKVMPVMEGATLFNYDSRNAERSFNYTDRTVARKITGMSGQPAFLWVGRLDYNKDPLTVLDGFESLLKKYPDANLYMIYHDDRLAGKVKEKIESSEVLRDKVYLLGKIDHNKIERYYNSADYFVLGSHVEGSGYALSEALSCGCVPIVTNIPSFTMMTNDGQLGALWKPGNKNSFVEAVTIAMTKQLTKEGTACIEFFKNNLSFDAIAAQAINHYRKIIDERRKKVQATIV